MRVYRDADADLGLITRRKVAIMGYGAQGAAHAANLRDSGVVDLVIAHRSGSTTAARAAADGFHLMENRAAAEWADLMMILAPDEDHGTIWADDLRDHLRPAAAIAFAHGLSIHFKLIEPRPDLDVLLVAPKGAGYAVRAEYERGGGVACLVGVQQDASGQAHDLAVAYAAGLGCGRAGIIDTSFRDECESDLFSEQAVLCGGIPHLILAGFETLVEAGYQPEVAYFECLHEAKLIVDLLYARGIAAMGTAISNTAEYGGIVSGPRIVTEETRTAMRGILTDIQSGKFVEAFLRETAAGQPTLRAAREAAKRHAIEPIGAELRAMMPWIGKENSGRAGTN